MPNINTSLVLLSWLQVRGTIKKLRILIMFCKNMCGKKILDVSDPMSDFDQNDTTKYLSFNSRGNHLFE